MASIEHHLEHIEQQLERLDYPEAAPAPQGISPTAGADGAGVLVQLPRLP